MGLAAGLEVGPGGGLAVRPGGALGKELSTGEPAAQPAKLNATADKAAARRMFRMRRNLVMGVGRRRLPL